MAVNNGVWSKSLTKAVEKKIKEEQTKKTEKKKVAVPLPKESFSSFTGKGDIKKRWKEAEANTEKEKRKEAYEQILESVSASTPAVTSLGRFKRDGGWEAGLENIRRMEEERARVEDARQRQFSHFGINWVEYEKQKAEEEKRRVIRQIEAINSLPVTARNTQIKNPYLTDEGKLIDVEKDYQAIIDEARRTGNKELEKDAREARFEKLFSHRAEYGKWDDGDYTPTKKADAYYGSDWQNENARKKAMELRLKEILEEREQEENRQKRIAEENAVLEKYGFNRDALSLGDVENWARNHNFDVGTTTDGRPYIEPKKEKGIFGKALVSDEAMKELEILSNIAMERANMRFADEHPVGYSAYSVATAPIRGASGAIANVQNAVDVARGEPIDVHSRAHTVGRQIQEGREHISGKYASEWFGEKELPVVGNAGEFLYNTMMSAGDSGMNVLVGSAFGAGAPAVSSFLMASDSAASQVIANKERGLSDKDALTLGLVSGAVEVLTEKIALEKIMGNSKTLVTRLLKSFVTEGAEEMAAESANIAIDSAFMGDDSQIAVAIQNYIKDGMSKKEATVAALTDSLNGVLSAGLAGGVSGIGMGGIYGGVNKAADALGASRIEEQGIRKPMGNDTINGTKETEIKYKITDIVGQNQNYGKGVYLDTDIFDNVKPREWNTELTKFVYNNLAGKDITVFAPDGSAEVISFAKANERVTKDGANNSHKVIDKLARAKGNINSLGIVHIDELMQTAMTYEENKEHSHQWLDENGWERRRAYMQDKNGSIYETTLNIAKTRDGRNILYALSQTKKVDDGEVSSASKEEGLAHKQSTFDSIVPQGETSVNSNYMQNEGENTANAKTETSQQSSSATAEEIKVIPGINRETRAAQEFSNNRPRYFEVVDGLAKKTGVAVEIDEDIDDADGFYDPKTKTVHLPVASNNPADDFIRVVVKHEFTHVMEGNKEYNELVDFIKKSMPEKWQEKRNSIETKYARRNAYNEMTGKEMITLSSEGFDAETMAEFAEEMRTDAYIEKVAMERPGLISKIRELIRKVMERFRNILPQKELTAWEQAEEKWKRALDAAVKSGALENDGEVRYKLSDNAGIEVSKALKDKNYKGEVKLTNNSPKILTEQSGVEDLPMVMKASHIRENILTEDDARELGLRVDSGTNYHGLGEELFLNVIDGLDEVTEAYRGTKNADNPARREKYFLLISKYTDSEGNTINVPVYVNQEGRYNNVRVIVNKIATVYGKNGLSEYLNREIERGNLVRIKRKSNRISGTTSPIDAEHETNASTDSIRNSAENVKEKFESQKIPEGVKTKLKDISDIVEEKTEADAVMKAEMRLAEVEKENRAIRDLNIGLRAEIQRTKDWKINPARVEEIVRKIKETYSSTIKITDVAAKVQGIVERLQESAESESFEQVYARSFYDLAAIGEEIAENSKSAKDSTLYEQYAELRKTIKDTAIKLSDKDKADMGDYEAFRKRNFGKIRLSNNATRSVDSFYEELSSVYPEWFDAETTHPADRLLRIEEVLHELQPTVNSMDIEDSGRAIAAELLEDLLKTSPADDQTIVDHLKKGYVKYYQDKNERLRQEYQEKLKKHKNKIKDRHERETLLRLVNEFARMRENLGRFGLSEIMKGEELEDFYFEDATEADIEELAKRMLTASEIDNGVTLKEKKAEVKEKMRLASERQAEKKKEYLDKIERAINELDGMGISILEKGYVREDSVKVMGKLELNRLREAYEAEKRTLGDDFVPNKRIENKITRLDRKQIADLDIADVQDLIEVMQAVKSAVRNENRLLNDEKNRKISEVAEKVREEIAKSGNHTDGLKFIGNKYTSAALTPIRRARQMVGYAKDSAFVKLFENLNEGSKKALRFKQNTSRIFEEIINREEMKTFAGKDAEVIEVATEAGNIKITPALRVSLYLHNKNFDNLRHIFYGGIVIPDVALLKKGKMSEAFEKGQTVKLTRRDINKICKGMTRFEYEFAEKAGKWLNEDCKQAINETSNIILGYDLARANNYMPISTDPDFTKTELLVQDGTLEGMGMLKSRAGGINPIYLMDILSVVENQNEKVSKYSGLAAPVRDFQAVYNQQGFDTSTKHVISKTWGKTGKEYVENLLKDLQGGRKKKSMLGNLRGKYAGAVLNLNVGTVFGQASGYPVIANTLGWDATLKALGKKTTTVDKELRAKYTPEFWMREKGYTTAEMGEYTSSQQGFFDNLPAGLDWLTAVDCLTTGKIWKAAEVYVDNEIAALKKKGGKLPAWAVKESDAYYKRVAEWHDKAMEETQPVYNVMQQPDLLRTDNELTRSLTMFMTQRLQNFGAVYDAVGEYNAAKKSGDDAWANEAKVRVGRALSAQFVSAAVYSAARFAGLLLIGKTKKYEDEEEKMTTESVVHGLTLEVLGTLASGSIGGSELLNMILGAFGDETWYGIQAPNIDLVNDISTSAIRLMDNVKDGKSDYRDYLKPFKTLAGDLGKLTGIPVSNIMDIVSGVGKNTLEAARRFAGVDTTMLDYQILRFGTPVSKKAEYGKFLVKKIKSAYYTSDGELKNKKYGDVEKITKDLVRIFGEEWVERYQNTARKEIYNEKYPGKENEKGAFELEKEKLKEDVEIQVVGDSFIEEYGNGEISYDGKTYKLNHEQTEKYNAKIDEKKSSYYDLIIGDNININEAFNGTEKHTSKTSESKERKVRDYFYYLADNGEITEAEAEGKYKQYLRGEIEVPVFDVYTSEYMAYDELTRSQRESIIDDKKKELKKGEITKAEYDSWYNEFVEGRVTYQKQKIIYGNYIDLDDETKSKVLTKIQNRATKEAQEEMRSEIVGK